MIWGLLGFVVVVDEGVCRKTPGMLILAEALNTGSHV